MPRATKKYPQDPKKSPSSITGFVCGLLSIIFCSILYLGLPLGILGIVFGTKGTKSSGSGLGKAGLILGIIGVSLTCLIYLAAFAFILIEYYT